MMRDTTTASTAYISGAPSTTTTATRKTTSTTTTATAMRSTNMYVTSAVIAIMTVGSTKMTSAEGDNLCVAPPFTHPLNESVLDNGLQIEWSTEQGMTCGSVQTCFPDSREEDAPLPVQLLPVDIPFGVNISFHSSLEMLHWILPSVLLEVDADGFRLCDVTSGVPVTDVLSTNDSLTLNSSLLTPGIHYFIVDLSNDSAVRCELGLRMKVTVKPVHCPLSQGQVCSDRGLCVTSYGQTDYSCFCCGRFKGEECGQYELCPCQHGGECQRNGSAPESLVCSCRLGFHGPFCEQRVEAMCDVMTCANNGTCTGNATHFRCACMPGYSGSHCEVNLNECASNPCVNGVCLDGDNGYTCYCKPGFHGKRCELDYDECLAAPCLNEGFCQNEQDNFTCHCHPGYKGRNCSVKIHVCSTLKPCRHGAGCREKDLSYTCICRPGFTGLHCEVNVDECAADPCLNGGTCVDRVAGYRCLCLDMHAGPNCQYPLDMFGPMIDMGGLQGEGGAEERAFHVRNMYVVSGTLSCAVVVVLGVLVTCYCRVRNTRPAPRVLRRHHNYTRHHDDLSQPVHDISSVSSPRLSVDAIWEATSLNYDVTQLGSPVRRTSLKPLEI